MIYHKINNLENSDGLFKSFPFKVMYLLYKYISKPYYDDAA